MLPALLQPLLLLPVLLATALEPPLFDCPSEYQKNTAGDSPLLCLSTERAPVPELATVGTAVNGTVQVALTAQAATIDLFPEHNAKKSFLLSPTYELPANTTTALWTFNGRSPGPIIKAAVGDTLQITLRNLLPSSVGFFIPGVFNARDPIEGGFVRPGATKIFRIPLLHQGTFRYFSSVDVANQVALGLHGVLVVTAKPGDVLGEVLVVNDILLSGETLQILTTGMLSGLERAEAAYNGRRGNLLTVNGMSVSNGYETVWGRNTKLVRFVNACSSRPLGVEIPGLKFTVNSCWAGTDAFLPGDLESDTERILVPPGATADLTLQIGHEFTNQSFELLVWDGTALEELRQATVGEGGSHEGLENEIVSVARTQAATDHLTSVVDLVLLPRSDGELSAEGFVDASSLSHTTLREGLSDVVIPVVGCKGNSICEKAIVWTFAIGQILPSDAELIDAAFVFELVCSGSDPYPRISVSLWALNDVDNEGRPAGPMDFTERPPLGRITCSCGLQKHMESTVDFSEPQLLAALQENRADTVGIGASIELHLDEQAKQLGIPRLFAASRLATEIAPPSLRLLFKTRQGTALTVPIPRTPAALLARQRQVERVFQELYSEQQNLKAHLHALYDRVKKRQRGGFRPVEADTKQNPVSPAAQEHLERILQIHAQDQQIQNQLQKRLLKLNTSTDIPASSQKQMIAEIQKQVEEFYLKQRQHNKELTELLQSMAKNQSTEETSGVSLTEVEKRAIKREKQLYVKLYRHYCALVAEMKQLRQTSAMLKRSASDPAALRAAVAGEVFKMSPITNPPTFGKQSLVHIKISDHSGPTASDEPPPERHAHAANLLHEIRDGRSRWTYHGKEAAVILLRVGQSQDADVTGRVPMWINASIQMPEEQRLLRADDWVVWEVVNPTPFSHVFYFHRALMEVFELVKIESDGAESLLPVNGRTLAHSNGRLYGLTVPAAPEVGGKTIVRTMSVVPRIVPSKTETFGLHQHPGEAEAVNWDIRIHSACREHSANGLSVRVRLEVEREEGDKNISAAYLGGIDYSNSDLFDEALDEGNHYGMLFTSVVLGVILLGGLGIVVLAIITRQNGKRNNQDYTELKTPARDSTTGSSTGNSMMSPDRAKFLKRRPATESPDRFSTVLPS